jgi:hypothetical protein
MARDIQIRIGSTSAPPVDPETIYSFEDSRLTYGSGWNSASHVGYSGGSERYTNATNAIATLKFTVNSSGGSFRIIGTKDTHHTTFGVGLDNVLYGAGDQYAPTRQYQQIVFESNTVSPGDHTLTIHATGAVPGSKYVTIDRVDVINGVAPVDPPVSTGVPWLTTNGSRIVTNDSTQADVLLRGVNMGDDEWNFGQQSTHELTSRIGAYFTEAVSWGANIFNRMFAADPVNNNDGAYLALLDHYVALAQFFNVYVTFPPAGRVPNTWHVNLVGQAEQDALVKLAQRYHGIPNVIYATQAEPHSNPGDGWAPAKARWISMIDAVRAVAAPHVPLFLAAGGNNFSRRINPAINDPILRPGVVYKPHHYLKEWEFSHPDYGFVASVDAGLPVLFGESGIEYNLQVYEHDFRAFLNYCDGNNSRGATYGYCIWLMSNAGHPHLVNSQFPPYTPNGEYAWDAKNRLGQTPPIPMNTGGAATAPSAPPKPGVVGGNGEVAVSWVAPNSGGSAITNYSVTVTPSTGVTGNVTRQTGNANTSMNFTGLTNGQAYTFRVQATNVVGTSAASPASDSVTPNVAPPSGTPKMATLTDAFTTSVDTSKWNSNGLPTIVNGRLNLPCVTAYASVTSWAKYDLYNSGATLAIPQVPGTGAGTTQATIIIAANSDNSYEMLKEGGSLYFRERHAAVNTQTSVVYNSTNHYWWRIRDNNAGAVFWETAPNNGGVPGTWTVQRYVATRSWSNLVDITIACGYYGAETSPIAMQVDSLNV